VTVSSTPRVVFPPPPTLPSELKAVLEAERAGAAFLVFRDGEGTQRIASLGPGDRFTLGRGSGNEVVLAWDPNASRVHAALERVGGVWTLVDHGLSRNGSWVNGERIAGRRRLLDGDVVRVGDTTLHFRAPDVDAGEATVPDTTGYVPPELTPMQRRVLVALARPAGPPPRPDRRPRTRRSPPSSSCRSTGSRRTSAPSSRSSAWRGSRRTRSASPSCARGSPPAPSPAPRSS